MELFHQMSTNNTCIEKTRLPPSFILIRSDDFQCINVWFLKLFSSHWIICFVFCTVGLASQHAVKPGSRSVWENQKNNQWERSASRPPSMADLPCLCPPNWRYNFSSDTDPSSRQYLVNMHLPRESSSMMYMPHPRPWISTFSPYDITSYLRMN